MTAVRGRWRRCWAGVACALVVMATGASAQERPLDPEELDRMSLEEILGLDVAAATKTDVPLAKAPQSITVITAEDIRRSTARTLPDLLRRVAGVDVRWNPMVPTVTIRGFGQLPFSSRVLFLVDGVPQNSANKGGYRPHPLPQMLDLQHVERVEVIRGPGAALYGENAFWGVVNIVTRDGADEAGGTVELAGGDRDTAAAGVRWGREVAGGEGSVLLSGRLGQTSFPMQFWRDSDSRVEAGDVLLKGRYRGWRLSYYRYGDEIDGFSQPLGPASRFASAETLEQTVDIAALAYDGQVAGGRVALGGNLSYARRDGMHCGACHAFGQQAAFTGPADHGSELLGEVRASFRPVPSHRVLVGVEARRVEAGDKTVELVPPESVGLDDYDYDKLAVYLQDELSLADDRLRVTAGLRYDGESGDLYGDEVSPRVAAVWTVSPRATLRASWGTAFRFPSLSERYQDSWWLTLQTPGGGSVPLAVFGDHADLEPEEIRTTELGGDFRARDDLTLAAHLFRSEVSGFVVVAFDDRTTPLTVTFENHPQDAVVLGGEVEASWRPRSGVETTLAWSYLDPSRRGEGTDLAGRELELVYAPQHHLAGGVFLGPWRGWSGALEGSWKDDYDVPAFWSTLTGREGQASGYALLDARLSWERPLAGRPVRLSLYATDLLDEAPRETLVGLDTSLPGRELFASVEVRF